MASQRDKLTRREVLAGAGAVTTTLGAVALGACRAPEQDQWDLEADLIIVGSGVAGATAALIAHENGDSVIVLEKDTDPGGTTAKSAGVFWIPNNFTLRDRDIADGRDDCVRYMARFSYPTRFDPESATLGISNEELALLEAFYDNASDAVDRLRELGALEVAEWRMFALDRPATDYLDQVPENKVPAGRPLAAVTPDGATGLGAELMRQLLDAMNQRSISLLTGHQAERVVMDDGRAVGLETRSSGGPAIMRARKGVVFATGGYAHNPEFVDLYQPMPLYGACAKSVSTGDFITIAGAAGAAMGNLGGAWRTQIVLEEALVSPYLGAGVFYPPGDSMIQVNRYGRRAVNEHRNYNDRTEAHSIYDASSAEFPNQLLFMIFDQRTAENFAGAYPLPETLEDAIHVVQGKSLEALATGISARLKEISPQTGNVQLAPDFVANLVATIERFNEFAVAGEDRDFNRGAAAYDTEWHPVFSPKRPDSEWPANEYPNITMYPISDSGPYYAIILAPGALDTNGGPVIDARARVIDSQGEPIPGLYGAGNCIASPSREAYYGAGHTIGMAMTFAYIAANAAHGDIAENA